MSEQSVGHTIKQEVEGDAGETTRGRPIFRPVADIYETPESVIVMADMPGVPPDAVDIDLERRILTIRGRVPMSEHTGYQRVYSEYRDGDFERSFTIAETIDQDNIKATQRDGVLVLELPKAEPAKARRIQVQAG